MVRTGNVIGFLALVAALAGPAWPAHAVEAGLDVTSAEFASSFDAGTRRRGFQAKLVEEPCDDEDAKACEGEDPRTRAYDFASSRLVTETVQGSDRLAELQWHCGQSCQADDLEAGLLVSLGMLAPGVPTSDVVAWKERVTPIIAQGGGVSSRLGFVRLDVFSNPRDKRATVTLTNADAPATNKNPSTVLIVSRIREAEKSIAKAIEISDSHELGLQSSALFRLMPLLDEDRDFDLRAQCRVALGQLANVVKDVTDLELTSTRAERAFVADRSLYIEAMMRCERELRLTPLGAPNLRG